MILRARDMAMIRFCNCGSEYDNNDRVEVLNFYDLMLSYCAHNSV